jgi:SAM-dependent methyltransferase
MQTRDEGEVVNQFLTEKALRAFDEQSAQSYRRSDEEYKVTVGDGGKFAFIKSVRRKFHGPVHVLDLGCGTGRYHHLFEEGDCIIGIDTSMPMLVLARNPVGGLKAAQILLCGDLHNFPIPYRFCDLIICMGVIGSQMPLSVELCQRVHRSLKPVGVFAFDAYKRLDYIQETAKSRAARCIRPFTFGTLRKWFDAKLMGFTLTEDQASRMLTKAGFTSVGFTEVRGNGRDDLLVEARGHV